MATRFSLDAYIAAQTAFMNLVKAGAGDPVVRIKSAAGVTLAECVIDPDTASVDSETGILTFPIATQEDSATGGTAAIAQVCDGDGDPKSELDCAQGTVAVANTCVVNTLTAVTGQAFDVVSVSFAIGDLIEE